MVIQSPKQKSLSLPLVPSNNAAALKVSTCIHSQLCASMDPNSPLCPMTKALYMAEVIAVWRLQEYLVCVACNAKITLQPRCHARQKTSFCKTRTSAQVTVSSGTTSVLFHACDFILRAITTPHRITEHTLMTVKPFTATYNDTNHLTTVYRPDDKPLDNCIKAPDPQYKTIKTAQIIAVPLLQTFPVCMCCGGKVTSTNKTIGICELCGIHQNHQHCERRTIVKIAFTVEDDAVTLDVDEHILKLLCFLHTISTASLLQTTPCSITYSDDSITDIEQT